MHVDEELCLCFHVSWRKVINYIRIHRVKLPSQLSECQSAGTGCGWCRAAMRRLVAQMAEAPPDADDLERWLAEEFPAAQHSSGRQRYIAAGQGQPPR